MISIPLCFFIIVRMWSQSVRYLLCARYLFILVILEKTIRIPRSLSVKAAGILKGFLNKNPTDRLGCHKESRFMEIQTHPFFKSIEWEAVSFQMPLKQILLNLVISLNDKEIDIMAILFDSVGKEAVSASL